MCEISATPVSRNYSLDVIRTFAILFVVANHAIEFIFPFQNKTNGVELFCNMSYTNQIFQFIVFTIGRLGVPLFFMLTGYLLVSRDYSTKEKITIFYKRNFIGIVLVWYIWILLYNVFLFVFEQKPFIIEDILLELLLIKNVPLKHTWYMTQIILIYAMIPLLSSIIKRIKNPIHIIILVSAILLISSVNCLYEGIRFLGFFAEKLMYIAYVIAGYYFAISKSYPNIRVCVLVFVIGFSVIVGWQIFSYYGINPTNVWYRNPLLYIVSFSLFCLLYKYDWRKGHWAYYIEMISKYSFGIYLLHVPVMKILLSAFPSIKNTTIINMVILHLITFFVCTIFISFFSKNHLIRKYIFYIK